MTLLDGEGQRVVVGCHAVLPAKYGGKGLYLGGVDDIAADAGLQQYGVDVDGLQAVEDGGEVGTLCGIVAPMLLARPVESLDGSEPYGAVLALGGIDELGLCQCRGR